MEGLTISDVVERTGVAEGTLRMWERRHGFPMPERLPSGHRRYSEEQLELVRRVVVERAAGLSLSAAIERARAHHQAPARSVFATLRRARPDLEVQPLIKPLLIALSHAIEDESLARAERPLLFASFQREGFYRQARERWRELSREATLAAVFADFRKLRTPRDGPAEIPVSRSHPLAREWTVVCEAQRHAVCLAAREPAFSTVEDVSRRRVFEVIWSVEPTVVRMATRACAEIVAEQHAPLLDPAIDHLASAPAVTDAEQLRLAAAITNRALSLLSDDQRRQR
jgi:MerR family transcriptional regulator, light-induced transcriptional regulator